MAKSKDASKEIRGLPEDSPYESVIGLEVHVQLNTRSKMFCSCENRFGAEANGLTCPVCLGHPGSLPVVNRRAVEYGMRVGLACGCEVASFTKFDRKNYFYPDQPKNYQISQFDLPVCSGGTVEFYVDGELQKVRLNRIHLEEDAGKNIHVDGRAESWVDLNRTGVPLIEIVSEPDLRSPEAASAYLRMLRQMMLYLGVSDCNMEEGSLRCDCNVSIRPRGATQLETRTEIKNVNSFLFVEKSLAFEIHRQVKMRERGEKIVQETRLFDPAREETRSMRGKEEAHDYRYFADPDLAPLRIDSAWIEEIRLGLPELPLQRHARMQRECGLSTYHADVLARDKDVADYFEEVVQAGSPAQEAANWVVNAVREELNSRRVPVHEVGISPRRLSSLVAATVDGKVSKQKARDVFKEMIGNDRSVDEVIGALGLEQLSDDTALKAIVENVIAAHPAAADDVRAGKKQSINFLMGQVMRESKGTANPGMVTKLIQELLSS